MFCRNPKKFNDVYLYDTPPSRCSPISVSGLSPGLSPREQNDCYDVPPRAIPVGNENFRNCPRCSPAPLMCFPNSSASSLTADSLSSSNRSSLANMPDYDVPKPYNRGPQLVLHTPQTYDIPSQITKGLPLELNSALENLERLQTDTTSAISKLLGFVGPQWRTKEKLQSNLMEIKLSVTRLGTSLHDLAEFGEGTLGNAARASDKNLSGQLMKKKTCKPDELEQLVMVFFLFKKEQHQGNNEWTEEYDYVSLDSKENISKNHAEILKDLPIDLKKGFNDCLKHADDVAFDGDHKSAGLDNDDKQLLTFYAAQIVTHHTNLTHAIDAFLQTVEHNQPPKIFLAHGKFVVLSAHKLVLIGDTVHRNVSSKEIKDRALNCANALSDALANSVNKTKQAALQFPSVNAVQEMVDSVVDISHAAKDLKVCLVQAAVPI
ncbi:hypothetical protein NQ317_010795 [Molorchus minor]|uniref:Breast cancer anti-estrogen resistance protein 1 n=1 Tax=Molorchus minor TaxID=1323400 RepID=A0ABQ9J746_9CUCU|nr:hypothetical protein NQ317_010795 [Molorchus minor]